MLTKRRKLYVTHRQKEVVITQQLTSFNYSKRVRSFHLGFIQEETKRMQNATHCLFCIYLLQHFFFFISVFLRFLCVCGYGFLIWIEVSLRQYNKLSSCSATTISPIHEIARSLLPLNVTPHTHTHTQMHSNKCKMLDLLTSNVDSVFVSQFANSLEPFGNRIKCAIPSAKHKLLSDTSNICTLLAEICQEFKHFVCRKNCNKELKMLISLRANE